MKSKYKIYAGIILLIYIVIIWPIIQKRNLSNTNVVIPETDLTTTSKYKTTSEPQTETTFNESISEQNKEIVVDLKGAVKNPGIYHLDDGARMYELIKIAGGLNQANEACINQAQIISDESKIIIPNEDEKCINANNSTEATNNSSSTSISSQKVNINSADISTLSTLPGIGNTRAQDIINYRNEKGKFKQIEDLKKVSGIGDQIFSKIQDLISV